MTITFPSISEYTYSRPNEDPNYQLEVQNPATGKVITTIKAGDTSTTHQAISKAQEAFLLWRQKSLIERGALLLKCADELEKHKEELAEILCMENGKPYADALMFDVNFVVSVYRYFGSLVDKLPTQFHDRGNMYVSVVRDPKGVTAGILPFNWPPIHFGGKTAPSLAAGNTIIIKPGEQAPLTVMRMVEIVSSVLPAGVVQAVPGLGPEVPQILCTSPTVKMVSFTGSTAAGAAVSRSASDTVKPVVLELGGKNAFIVFEDADITKAAEEALEAAFFNKGEACTAGSRILIHESIHDEFVEKLQGFIKKLKVGDGMDKSTHIGPCVSKAQQQRVQNYISIGLKEGAQISAQAPLPQSSELKDGFFVPPTLFTSVTPTMKIAQEEIFGPVVTVTTFTSEAEALSIANSSPYGLTAIIFTRDMERGMRVSRLVESGMVFLNNYRRSVLGLPFGGVKASGHGREHCIETLGEWSNTKFIQFPSGVGEVRMWRAVDEICK